MCFVVPPGLSRKQFFIWCIGHGVSPPAPFKAAEAQPCTATSWGRRRHIDLYKLHASENISSLKLFYAAAICITKPIPKTFSFFYSILFCLSDIVLRGVDGLHHPAGCEYWGQCFRWGRVGVVTQSCLGCIWNSWVQCFRGLQVQEKEPSYLNEGLAQLHLMETT